jgi:hypothetical protein
MVKPLKASIDFIASTTFYKNYQRIAIISSEFLGAIPLPLFKIYLPLIYYNNLGKLSYPEDREILKISLLLQ